jgi:putative ABC transport system substrate-binding protein
MATIGILHGGSPQIAQSEIKEITNQLKKNCKKGTLVIEVSDWNDNLLARAKSLAQKKPDATLVLGGSRAAHAAIEANGASKNPIVFTTVAPYILDEIKAKTWITGVCAHTSDHDAARLDWLLKMLGYDQPTIGVLLNSNRGDVSKQLSAIADAAQDRCVLDPKDLNGPLTIRKAFELFEDKVDALLVAADPFFYRHRQEVVDRAKVLDKPAIYQWSDFVVAGGLMSFGPDRDDCIKRAIDMVATIHDQQPVPPIYEVPDTAFQLVVSQSRATHFGRWPLPSEMASDPRLVLLP